MQEWREETTAIVNELLADGSNPDLEYEIEHHFACQKFDLLEKAALDLFKAGFEVTDAEEMELDDGATIFCFDATVECKLDIETIVADIATMLPILEKYGVDYDGWGTYFQEYGASSRTLCKNNKAPLGWPGWCEHHSCGSW